jgi:hypothetical protein
VKPPEKADIAANPPRILKKKPDPDPLVRPSGYFSTRVEDPKPLVKAPLPIQEIPKMPTVRRQNSVQPVRPPSDLRTSFEKRKPIRLEEGGEREYLDSLRQSIEDERTSELASSMPFIARDLLTLISNPPAAVSAVALQVMNDLLPIYAPHFRAILPSLVESLIAQIEIGNPRSGATSLLILSNLHKSFDGNSLLLICLTQSPSVPLLNFTEQLVSLNSKDIDITNDTVCQKLLQIAFRCHALGAVKNKRTAARIVERVNAANSTAVAKFADSLRGHQLSQFAEFVRPYVPDLKLTPGIPDVPPFNPRSPTSWKRKVQTLIETTRNESNWNSMRSKLFAQLNQSLRDKSEGNAIDIVQQIFANHGCDGFADLLGGILLNSRGTSARIVDTIVQLIVKECELPQIFGAIQPIIVDPDPELARAALGLQTKLLAGAPAPEIRVLVTSLIPGLTSAFESDLPEIRKAVVLCFVELYAKLGKEYTDRHTSHLSKGQQKLIAIYLSRRKETSHM